ncbi:hypothetical protein [Succinivibrio sp.]|uniref:hypothetical protein n=1 Tax=Succinivibrio sp. TaxID=2053619 RepID=UPI0025F25DBA|nr:hypothetical protein [Succinivibrio sp.]MBQ9220428.1 hypothetical protein [Succinivibrio sp.]
MSEPATQLNDNTIEIDNLITLVTRDVSTLADDKDYRFYNKLGSSNSFNSLLLNVNYSGNKEHFQLAQFHEYDKENGCKSTLNIERLQDGTYELTQIQTFDGQLEPEIETEHVPENELEQLLENLFSSKPHLREQYEEQIKDRQVFFSVSNLIQRAGFDVRCNHFDDLNLLDLDDRKKEEFREIGEDRMSFDGLVNPEIYEKVFNQSEKTICKSESSNKNANTQSLKFELKEIEDKKTHKKMYVMCETVKHANVEQKLYSRFRTLDDFKLVAGAVMKHTYPEIEQDMSNQIQQHKKKAHSFFNLMHNKPQIQIAEQVQYIEEQKKQAEKQVEIIENLSEFRKQQEEKQLFQELPAAVKTEDNLSFNVPAYKPDETIYIEDKGTTPETEALLSNYGHEMPFFLKQKRSIWECSKNLFRALPSIIEDTALTFYKGLREINSEKYMNVQELSTYLGRAYLPEEKLQEIEQKNSSLLTENKGNNALVPASGRLH